MMEEHGGSSARQMRFVASLRWKTMFTVFLPPMAGLFAWLAALPFVGDENQNVITAAALFLVGTGFSAFFLYALASIHLSRIEILPDRIRDIGVFTTRDLMLDEISGFRVLRKQYANTLELVTKSPGKKIKADLVFKNNDALLKWASERFADLDAVEYEKEKEDLLGDGIAGGTRGQRADSLERAKSWARLVNGAGFLAALWGFFLPKPYTVCAAVLVLLPITALTLLPAFRGLITFDEERNSLRPSIAFGYIMPVMALALRAGLDWNILEWRFAAVPWIAVTVALCYLLFLTVREVRRIALTTVFAILVVTIQGFGTTIMVNGLLDTSTPVYHGVQVTGKSDVVGRRPEYRLTVEPWGPRRKREDLVVSRDIHDKYGIGDTVVIEVYGGALKIPWFTVR